MLQQGGAHSCLSFVLPHLLLPLCSGDPRQQRAPLQGQHKKQRQGAQQLSPQQRLLNVAAAAGTASATSLQRVLQAQAAGLLPADQLLSCAGRSMGAAGGALLGAQHGTAQGVSAVAASGRQIRAGQRIFRQQQQQKSAGVQSAGGWGGALGLLVSVSHLHQQV